MRIWDVPPDRLCRNHLLGEHAELHAIWSILTQGKSGFANHPETLRWKGKLKALYSRHERLADEMALRGYTVSYTHLRAHETRHDLVCRLLLEKKKKTIKNIT